MIAVDPQPDAVGGVVGAAELEVEADPLDQRLGAIGHAVAVVVVVGGQVGRVEHVERAGVVDEAAGAVHLGEDVELVGLAVAVVVDAADDPAAAGPGVERAVLVDADEELAGRRRRQAGRVADVRRLGEQRHLEPGGHLDLAEQAVVAGPLERPRPAEVVVAGRRRDLVRPVDLDLEDAGPGAVLQAGDGHPDVADAPGEELVRAVLVALVALGLVREHRPRLAVVRALDLVPVVDPVLLPDDADAGQVLGLAEVDLPPLRAGRAVGAPAGLGIAVDGGPGPMVGALRRGGRRRLPLRRGLRGPGRPDPSGAGRRACRRPRAGRG